MLFPRGVDRLKSIVLKKTAARYKRHQHVERQLLDAETPVPPTTFRPGHIYLPVPCKRGGLTSAGGSASSVSSRNSRAKATRLSRSIAISGRLFGWPKRS